MRGALALCVAFTSVGIGVCTDARADGGEIHASIGTTHEALFAISLDGNAGVAVGGAGDLRESADGGKTWKAATAVPTSKALLGVCLHATHAIAVGQEGVIVVRSGSGAWSTVSSGTDARLMAVGVNAAGSAIAVGAFGTVLKSSDAGQHWEALKPQWADYVDGGAEPHLYGVSVSDDGVVTMVGEFGLVLRSRDNGATWESKHKGEASLFGLDLLKDGTGYAVGQDGTALKTIDNGVSWNAIDIGSKANLLAVAALGNGSVYVSGMHEVLASKDAGNSWHALESKSLPAIWYSGLAAADGATYAIAVGQAGAVVQLGR
jgi:photosystem II stability/assembly factor-like uncharacterized protein